MRIRANSPIDLIVTDPDGLTITPDSFIQTARESLHEILGELYYSIYDMDEDGIPKTEVYSPRLKRGNYVITPVKRKDAPPNAVYSISMLTDVMARLIAKDVPVDRIPPTGYGVTVKETGLTPFVPVVSNLPPAFQLLEPNGGDIYKVGKKMTIRWNATGISSKKKLQLKWSKNGGMKWKILKLVKNSGHAGWKPKRSQATDQARLMICAPKTKKSPKVCDQSDGNFTIVR
jgi:hypothetical protein